VIYADVERRFLDRDGDDREEPRSGDKEGEDCGGGEGNCSWPAAACDGHDPIAAADFVVEAVPEKMEIKRAVLGEADGICGLK